MNKRFSLMMSLAVVMCCFGQTPNAEDDVAVSVKVSLADGSQLQGTLHTSSLALVTGFGGAEIPLAQIATLDVVKDGVKVKFRNRDVLSGTLEGSAFVLRTIFNDVNLDSSQIKSIQFLGGRSALGKEPGLLLHAQLDSASENLGAFNAYMEVINAQVIEGPSGGDALLLGSEDAQISIQLPFSPYTMSEGTIEFWGKLPQPHQRFGNSRGQPWFFNIDLHRGAYPGCHFGMGFCSNNGHALGGLVGHVFGILAGTHSFGAVSTVAGTGLLGDTPDGWHHYMLVWRWDGMEFPEVMGATLLMAVDGKVVASSKGQKGIIPPDIAHEPNIGTRLFIHDYNSDCTRPVAMSDLKIWDHPKFPDRVNN